MKSNLPTTSKAPETEKPLRKILGFYFDLDGKISVWEEGLGQTEKLALLYFIQHYAVSVGREEVAEMRKQTVNGAN